MRKWSRYVAGVVAITGLLALVVSAGAETCKLETKQFDRTARSANAAVDNWFRYSSSQSFFMQIGGPEGMIGGSQGEGTPEFSKVIQKEPSQYNSPHPFRGVAKLGSQYFGFVMDSAAKPDADEKDAGEKKDEAKAEKTEAAGDAAGQAAAVAKLMKTVAYQRLYFDINHNGDLTDDAVIESKTARGMPSNYVSSSFPNVALTIEVDGAKLEYAFTMSVYSYAAAEYSYANASLTAAAYREGEMVMGDKKYRVVIVDFNSNGRFDDRSEIDPEMRIADGTVYPSVGDMLYVIDPDRKPDRSANPYDPTSNEAMHYVAKQIHLDGRFFDLRITPAGDELTLEPSPIPVGYVTNANKGYRAIVYGEQGFLKVVGDESGKAPLPVGQWKLASYTIDRTGIDEPEKEEPKEGSLFDTLKRAITGAAPISSSSAPRYTMVSARAKRDYKAVEVAEGQTVELPFGEPYRPEVTVGYREGAGQVSLSMGLIGSADEVCTNMMVDGGRPERPKFTISTEKGEVVQTGNFEYG